jgi:hypothetical protein
MGFQQVVAPDVEVHNQRDRFLIEKSQIMGTGF